MKTVQQIKSRICKKIEGKYPKTLAKIQVTAVSLKQDMRIIFLPIFIEIRWAPTSVTEFCYNLSLEELKNVTIIFSNTRTVQIAKFPEMNHFFNQYDSFFGRHVNAASRKSLEIQAWSITKAIPIKCSVSHRTPSREGGSVGWAKKGMNT